MLYSVEVKDPNATIGIELDWAPHLGGATIDDSDWFVPAGITPTGFDKTATTTSVGLTGGTLGSSYRLINRVTFTGGGNEDWTVDVPLEEPVVLPLGPPYATLSEAVKYQEKADGEEPLKVGMVLEDASDMVARFAPRPAAVTTQLSEAINSTQTTIPVKAADYLPDRGTLYVDSELIYYFGKTSTSGGTYTGGAGILAGAVRGRHTTTPASHSQDASVTEVDYALKARRAELVVFEWLWDTRGYKPARSGVVGSESYSIDMASIRDIVRQQMGRYYLGGQTKSVPVVSAFPRNPFQGRNAWIGNI